MGNCAASQYTKKGGGGVARQATAKVIHMDGRLQEFKQPIKASHLLTQNPKHFLCSTESMYVDHHLPQVPATEELQLGQIYFLMPLSKSRAPLSLQELCSLACIASAALAQPDMGRGYPDGKGCSVLVEMGSNFWHKNNGVVIFR
ncbi:hypothetical protein Tsubulata_008960 [Turnera subulata]|uniref:Uncharacterized protein n=1 Tax=Turnera subulata TaxID=218843 RepID=A0A9Q0FQU0_9ROSI|nr:hypothetical protein Tsubulata_008960 [Turnera subulata]